MTSPSVATRLRFVPAAFRTRRGFALGFLATLLVGLLLLIGASAGIAISHADRIMPGVSVAGVNVGDLDRAAAAARLRAELPSLSTGSLTLDVDGRATSVPLSDLHREYDIDATLDAAFAVARSGNPLQDGIQRLRTMTGPSPAGSAVIAQDDPAVAGLAASIARQFDRDPQDASVRRAGPTFVQVPAVTGITVDLDALRNALAQVLATAKATGPIDVLVTRQDPAVSTEQATAAAKAATAVAAKPLALKGAGKKVTLSRDELADFVTFRRAPAAGWGLRLNEQAIWDRLVPIAKGVVSAPRNASFAWGGNGVVGFYPGATGRRLSKDASIANVVAALERRAGGVATPSAGLAVRVIQPAVTNADARKVAPEMRMLGSWTTYFVPSDGNFWGANITIPARDIDGRVIAPGEWFEFWQGIGPVTLAHGYGYGGAIIGGRSVANGALAGGICSTSTTLFNAAMRAGLQIGQRTNHSYYIDRYPVGLDATVFKTDSYETDMTFRNDTANPIVIRSSWGSGFVRFDIWGVPDGRTVTLSKPTTSNYGTAVWTTAFNPDLPAGTSKIVEYPHNGFDAVVTRWVRDAKGNIIHQDTWYSHYRTVNGVTEYGPKRASN
jgi:vancomycin resistance protein YoaR